MSTEVFEGYPQAEAVDTLTLTEAGGVTTLAVHVLRRTKQNRDGHVLSGMEAGMQLAMNRLESLLNAPDTESTTTKENRT